MYRNNKQQWTGFILCVMLLAQTCTSMANQMEITKLQLGNTNYPMCKRRSIEDYKQICDPARGNQSDPGQRDKRKFTLMCFVR